MANCDSLISSGIGLNCPSVGRGYEQDAVIINYDDIDWANTTIGKIIPADSAAEADPHIISSLVLKTGKKGYAVKQRGNQPFTGTQTEMNDGGIVKTFKHTVSMIHLDYDAEAAVLIDELKDGKFVLVAKAAGQVINSTSSAASIHDKGKYPIYGIYQGLKASEITRDAYSEDTQGGWQINLVEENAPYSGVFLYAEGGDAATEALFNSLKTEATNPG